MGGPSQGAVGARRWGCMGAQNAVHFQLGLREARAIVALVDDKVFPRA